MAQLNSSEAVTKNASFEDNETPRQNDIIVSFLVLMSIAIVIINSFVVFLVWKRKILRTPTNICLTSLACSDFLSGSCAIPLIIACDLVETRHSRIGPRCLSMDLINRMLSISAILHLLVIAVERYVVIVRHVKPDDFLSCKKYAVIVSAVWLISLCTSLIQLKWVDVKNGVPQIRGVSQPEIIYGLVCVFGFVFFPLLIILIAYSKVFAVLRRHTKEIEKHKVRSTSPSRIQKHKLKEKRATLIYALMMGFYVIGWFPYFLISLFYDLGAGERLAYLPFWANTTFMFCRFLSPLVNPVLYTFFKQDFKEVICSLRRRSEGHADKLIANACHSDVIQMTYLRNSATSGESI